MPFPFLSDESLSIAIPPVKEPSDYLAVAPGAVSRSDPPYTIEEMKEEIPPTGTAFVEKWLDMMSPKKPVRPVVKDMYVQ